MCAYEGECVLSIYMYNRYNIYMYIYIQWDGVVLHFVILFVAQGVLRHQSKKGRKCHQCAG